MLFLTMQLILTFSNDSGQGKHLTVFTAAQYLLLEKTRLHAHIRGGKQLCE